MIMINDNDNDNDKAMEFKSWWCRNWRFYTVTKLIASTTDCMQKEMYTIQKKRLFVVERMTNLR